ncbi:MAG: hypothetical protein IJX62_04815 [Clostridia bacterium]|nr:hypothetical protein [Clostridia bacterium]
MFSLFKNTESEDRPGKGRLWIIAAGAAVGILLILLGGGIKTGEHAEAESRYELSEDEMILYQNYLEERIKILCESVDGVGDVTAIVTFSGSFESVYATEWEDGNEKYVILGSGSSATALYLTRSAPQISGIGIVCYGGGNANVRQELTSLLSATFHVSTNRIYVTARQD